MDDTSLDKLREAAEWMIAAEKLSEEEKTPLDLDVVDKWLAAIKKTKGNIPALRKVLWDLLAEADKFPRYHRDYSALVRKTANALIDTMDKKLQELKEDITVADSVKAKELTDIIIMSEFLEQKFILMLNSPMTSDIMATSIQRTTHDVLGNTATYTNAKGRTITITGYDKITGTLGVAAKKMMNHAIFYLKCANYYKGKPGGIVAVVHIPIDEYGALIGRNVTPAKMDTPEAQEAENKRAANSMKQFKKDIKKNLDVLTALVWTATEPKGRNKGNYIEQRIISSHSIYKNILEIVFDIKAATYLVNSYLMQYPAILYKFDERKPNAYAVAYKIAFHNSNDNNARNGTENTLSVASLLEAASDIPSYDSLIESGRRDWKFKIKKLLEKAIDECVIMGFIGRWEYRDPRTGETYTPETTGDFDYLRWHSLMVDFTVVDAPDQQDRREAKRIATQAKRLAAAAETEEAPIKKDRQEARDTDSQN